MAIAQRALTRLLPKDLYYGWYIVLSGAIAVLVSTGIIAIGFGAFIGPMRAELGWSVAAISAGYSIRTFESGFLAPFTGFLLDRAGARKMAIIGVLVTALGLLLFSQARVLTHYYAASMLMALGQSLGGGGGPYSLVVMKWFVKKRGRALALMNLGNGTGYFLAPIIVGLIALLGWRHTLIVLTGLLVAVCLPLAFVLRSRPEDSGYLPDGEKYEPAAEKAGGTGAQQRALVSEQGLTVRQALRTPAFYYLMLAGAITGSSFGVWSVHLVPHLTSVGYSAQTAGAFLGIFGAVSLGNRLLIGWLADKVGRRNLYIATFFFLAGGLFIFANLRPERLWLLFIYFPIHTAGIAGFSILGQSVIADYFGTRRLGSIRGLSGIVLMPMGVGLPILAGWIFDQTGSYYLAFSLMSGICASGVVWVLLAGKPRAFATTPAEVQRA